MKTVLKFSGKWIERGGAVSEMHPRVRRVPGGFLRVEEPIEGGGFRVRKVRVSHTASQFSLRTAEFIGYFEKAERSAGADNQGADDSDLVAQFPGKVLKVLVREGDRVEAGQALVLVEAMKMEFAVKAPRDGRVVALAVREGAVISPGLKLVEIE